MKPFNKALSAAALLFALAMAPLQADAPRSPEALAMAFVQAFRAGDSDTLASLHAQASDAGQTGAWRMLMRDYRLTGYRVSHLRPAERGKPANNQSNPIPLPIKKFEAQLVAVRSGERLVLKRYIGARNGRFYFVMPDVR